jgi:hypothetical protein
VDCQYHDEAPAYIHNPIARIVAKQCSSFADNLSKNDLKTHVSTLRKDRAESLHKVTSELEQLNKGIIDLNKLLVGCAYLKRIFISNFIVII